MSLHYIKRKPENITSETPILVLLHGYGSNEEDLFSFVPGLPEDWFVVSFQAPRNTPYGGFCWYDIDFVNSEKFIDVPQAEESMKMILDQVSFLKAKYGIVGNTHLCGFSQGGILSYALALKYPHLFQKVACLSAYPEAKILKDISQNKKELEQLRFFVSHGTKDMVIPIEWAQKGSELLYDLGVFFTFREYPSGHGINLKNYQDLMQFFRQ